MTCGSGCCGTPKNPEASTLEGSSPKVLQDRRNRDRQDSCGGGNASDSGEEPAPPSKTAIIKMGLSEAVEDNHSEPPAIVAAGCQDGCCGQTTGSSCEMTLNESSNKLCAPKPFGHDEKDYASPETPSVEDPDNPNCCRGKIAPCCDASCIERLALRECVREKPVAPSDGGTQASGSCASSPCHQGDNGKPCSRHSRSAQEKFGASLEALGCICRALLALGQESCCAPIQVSSGQSRKRSKKASCPRSSAESCCAAMGTSTGNSSTASQRPDRKKICHSPSAEAEKVACSRGCCAKPNIISSVDPCADACCAAESASRPNKEFKGVFTDAAPTIDLEKALLGGREHIILSISGMTCTGCETKLKRTLDTLGSVKNLKTSLVLARAEFDLDLGAGSLTEVMKHLERTTEFKCEKVSNQGSNLDLITPGDSANFSNRLWPNGVTEITVVDKGTVHVAFDAKVVGARDLIERGWDAPISLAPLRTDPALEAGGEHVRHMGYMTLLSAILTIPVLIMAWAPLPEHEIAYGSASLALATIVQFAVAGPFYPKALKSLVFSRMVEMDLLIVLSTTVAYVFSVVSFGYLVAGQPLSTGEFFETSTLLVTLIMVGRYVAALARQKAVESISIRSLQTSTALLVEESAQEREVDVRLLQYGDVFKVVPESRIPTDGTVVSGSSEVNESMITGESRPVEKHPRSPVMAGSINGSGTLTVRLTRLPGDNTISTIAGMVDEAKLSKPKIQGIADQVASYFVPTVVALAVITLVIWIAVGVTIRRQSGSGAAVEAITYAITVLIVSCPCAIGLAVPMVVVIASGIAAERGVIFKSADSIEVAYKTSHVVFDKTGTLTQGKLSVIQEEYIGGDSSSTRALLLGLVGSIKHPVSAAVATYLKTQGVAASAVSNPKTLAGSGVEGTALGMVLRAGNARWLNLSSNPLVQSVLTRGHTAFCFTINDSLAAIFALEDNLRHDAVSTLAALRERGIAVHIVSGDDDGAVRSVATQLGIPGTNIRSRCTPADKQMYIQHLLAAAGSQDSSRKTPKTPVVIFCGDGTNDAIALAQATIGVHMNEGTDVAQAAADVVLVRPNLSGILTTISISRVSINRILFNFAWSFVYNLFAILLGAGAFVNARIPPEFAGLGELVSVLPVITAAVLIRWYKI